MISDFLFKKLGRLIHSEESNGDYEIHERFADRLLDAGYIEYLQWNEPLAWGHMHCVRMISTEKGREAYLKWKELTSGIARVNISAMEDREKF